MNSWQHTLHDNGVWELWKPQAPYAILTCRDLAYYGLWNTQYCCYECHTLPQTMCLGLDEYYWDEQTVAVLCSASYWWFLGARHDPYAIDTRDGLFRRPLHYLGKQPIMGYGRMHGFTSIVKEVLE